eukprot:COSAG01_NODE_53931_length_335_cov_3.313559_1_plen_64_part_01
MARHSGPITAVRCIWVIELTGPAMARDRGLERCERGAARGNSSLLQSPAAGVDSHAPVDSETQI